MKDTSERTQILFIKPTELTTFLNLCIIYLNELYYEMEGE